MNLKLCCAQSGISDSPGPRAPAAHPPCAGILHLAAGLAPHEEGRCVLPAPSPQEEKSCCSRRRPVCRCFSQGVAVRTCKATAVYARPLAMALPLFLFTSLEKGSQPL